MKKMIGMICLLVLAGGFQACGRTAEPQQGGSVNLNGNPGGNGGNGNPGGGSGGNGGGVTLGPLQVVFNLFPVGAAANRIAIVGDTAYVVNSGDNNIEKIDLVSHAVTQPFVRLPSGSNPWEMAISGTRGYVTNYVSNNVSVIDLTAGSILTTISGNTAGIFNDPEGIAVADNGLVFVSNVDFDPLFHQGPGFVTVIDSATNQVVNQIPSTQKNPQFVTAAGNMIYVTNSGDLEFQVGCGCFKPHSDGGVDLIDATQARTAQHPTANIPIPLDPNHDLRGYPGGFAVTTGGNTAYLGSNSGTLYKVDLVNRTLLRGNSNPIVVTTTETDNLISVKADSAGLVWVVNFNQDRAHLLDPATDTVVTPFISLDSDTNNLEGPLDLAFRSAGSFPDVYVLMSLSERISVIITN